MVLLVKDLSGKPHLAVHSAVPQFPTVGHSKAFIRYDEARLPRLSSSCAWPPGKGANLLVQPLILVGNLGVFQISPPLLDNKVQKDFTGRAIPNWRQNIRTLVSGIMTKKSVRDFS